MAAVATSDGSMMADQNTYQPLVDEEGREDVRQPPYTLDHPLVDEKVHEEVREPPYTLDHADLAVIRRPIQAFGLWRPHNAKVWLLWQFFVFLVVSSFFAFFVAASCSDHAESSINAWFSSWSFPTRVSVDWGTFSMALLLNILPVFGYVFCFLYLNDHLHWCLSLGTSTGGRRNHSSRSAAPHTIDTQLHFGRCVAIVPTLARGTMRAVFLARVWRRVWSLGGLHLIVCFVVTAGYGVSNLITSISALLVYFVWVWLWSSPCIGYSLLLCTVFDTHELEVLALRWRLQAAAGTDADDDSDDLADWHEGISGAGGVLRGWSGVGSSDPLQGYAVCDEAQKIQRRVDESSHRFRYFFLMQLALPTLALGFMMLQLVVGGTVESITKHAQIWEIGFLILFTVANITALSSTSSINGQFRALIAQVNDLHHKPQYFADVENRNASEVHQELDSVKGYLTTLNGGAKYFSGRVVDTETLMQFIGLNIAIVVVGFEYWFKP